MIIVEQDEPIEVTSDYQDISFLYSERQTINIFANTSLYEIKFFNVEDEFKNELLYIYGSNNNYAMLDNCQKSIFNPEEVICTISKEKIEEILSINNEQFKVGAITEGFGIYQFLHILNITINYENVQKENIYLEIKEIMGGTTETDVPIGFVTNATYIPNFISAKFEDIKFFKKTVKMPLMLFYSYSSEGDYNFKFNNTKEMVKNDIFSIS